MAVCTSIGHRSIDECISISLKEEMVEIRADLCGFSVEETVSVIKGMKCRKILTARGLEEEGFLIGVLGLLEQGDLQFVDLELEASRDYSERVSAAVHSLGGRFIVSFHDFQDTPCIDELKEIYEICVSRGADIVKIVTTASRTEDVSRVLQLYYQDIIEKPLVAFAMGEKGSFSRRLCLSLGAPFTYCSFEGDSPTAPGQLTSERMRTILSPDSYPIDLHSAPLCGDGILPCSKSFAQRAIIAASLAPGMSVLHGYGGCDDTGSALAVARAIGAGVQVDGDKVLIRGISPDDVSISRLDVGESGLLARMMVMVSSLFLRKGGTVTVEGRGTLLRRDLSDVTDIVRSAGGEASSDRGRVPVTLREAVRGGEIEVDGSRSSQGVSGLLMTLPLLPEDSVLKVNHAVSLPYLEMTVRVMKTFGILLEYVMDEAGACIFRVKGGQCYLPAEIVLEPDWSSMAYLAVAAHLARYLRPGWKISVPEIRVGTGQADERVMELMEKCGPLAPFVFDMTDSPDLFPIAAVLACFCSGTSELAGVGRLFQKESDRAESILSELTILGGRISIMEDRMYITGCKLHGGLVMSHHDHRMAMALAVAALFIDDPVRIDEMDCVSKSFPGFQDCLSGLVVLND